MVRLWGRYKHTHKEKEKKMATSSQEIFNGLKDAHTPLSLLLKDRHGTSKTTQSQPSYEKEQKARNQHHPSHEPATPTNNGTCR